MVGGGGEVAGGAAGGVGVVGQGAEAGWHCLATEADDWAAAGSDLAAGFAVAARVFALQRAYDGGGAGVRALLFWRGKTGQGGGAGLVGMAGGTGLAGSAGMNGGAGDGAGMSSGAGMNGGADMDGGSGFAWGSLMARAAVAGECHTLWRSATPAAPKDGKWESEEMGGKPVSRGQEGMVEQEELGEAEGEMWVGIGGDEMLPSHPFPIYSALPIKAGE